MNYIMRSGSVWRYSSHLTPPHQTHGRITHGVAGWHFILQNETGLENYFSEDGRVYSNAVVRSENLVIASSETDSQKVRLLRRLWEEYIMRLDLLLLDSPDVVAIV